MPSKPGELEGKDEDDGRTLQSCMSHKSPGERSSLASQRSCRFSEPSKELDDMKSLREQHGSGDLTKRQLHRLGSSEVGLRKVVNDFHEALQIDEELGPVFEKVDLASCSKQQAHFLELALADGAEADSKAWHRQHLATLKERGLTPQLFERYQKVFKTTMQELQLPEARIESAVAFMQGAW